MAARHDDTPDLWRRILHQSDLESRRPLRRLSNSGGHVLGSRRRSGEAATITQSKNALYPWSFTPDGKRLAFMEAKPGTGWCIWTLPVESDRAGLQAGKPEVFLQA